MMQVTIGFTPFDLAPVCHVATVHNERSVSMRLGHVTLELPGRDQDALATLQSIIDACLEAEFQLRQALKKGAPA